ncbi:MAG: uracil-DNA glycosylase family protein [Bacteroidales bacterium]|nr:uracil-DNA glycosylase family protein [Bacteroidales bacterium]MDE7465671.1 uracil-DNA glycosylase family protein [Muribaculaceae bacterium]
MKENDDITVKEYEYHPWPPYIPNNAKVLIMGTFPPQPKRWSMNFYYPNRTNDFWRIMGIIFYNDKNALYDESGKNFDIDKIKKLLDSKGIALNDTGHKIHRQMGNASDKYLEIVEPVDLKALLKQMPECRAIATTGEKAAGVIADLTSTEAPKMGEKIKWTDTISIWRMPSTSRAYPVAPEKKAEFYAKMFREIGIL